MSEKGLPRFGANSTAAHVLHLQQMPCRNVTAGWGIHAVDAWK